ncbi:MAG: hypothetical protein K8U57_29115 [Planctomycetes bacterium]|nr:hypothetical protein [Planctomycetota bacterium]
MILEPREFAVVESYPTFWTDDNPPTPRVQVSTEEAYTAFVNCSEDELPEDSAPDAA